jgi:hypothetical protein
MRPSSPRISKYSISIALPDLERLLPIEACRARSSITDEDRLGVCDMKYLFVVFALITSLLGGCCYHISRVEPSYPSQVSGWLTDKGRLKFYEEHKFWARGDFVLRKNEASDDGKIRIKVIDLIPPDPCAESGSFQRQARVTIQFIRVADQSVLCEEAFPEHGYLTVYSRCGDSLNKYNISGVGVSDINLKEGWAFIHL